MSRDGFAEELFDAITEMDDFLILESESALLHEQESKEPVPESQVIPITSKRRNRKLMLAACFAFIIVASVPVISILNGEFAGFATKDEASMESADEESFDMYGGISSDSIFNDTQNSQTTTHSQLRVMTEKWGEYAIYTNFYYGYILDDSAKDPQEVLSLMKITRIDERNYYIVVVRDERVKVYDADTLEPLFDNPGTSVADVALELGIAG